MALNDGHTAAKASRLIFDRRFYVVLGNQHSLASAKRQFSYSKIRITLVASSRLLT